MIADTAVALQACAELPRGNGETEHAEKQQVRAKQKSKK